MPATIERCGKKGKYRRSAASHLPRDIIADILCRLPIKSVVRFGIASQFWSQIIGGDPDFQHSYFNQFLAAPPSVMMVTRENGVITMNLSRGRVFTPCDAAFGHLISTPPRSLDYANTCNGLLCFLSPEDGSVLLCNPITGELVALPPAPEASASPPPEASPPPNPNYSVGLGFSPSTREYKVVRLSYSCSSCSTNFPLIAEVCTLGSPSACCSWRQVRPIILSNLCPPESQKPLYVDGKIHWIHQEMRLIVSFDVGSELFTTTPMNPEFGPGSVLVELGGKLSLVNFSSPNNVEVWVLLKDSIGGGRWDKLCFLSVCTEVCNLNRSRSRLIHMWERGGSLLIWLQDAWITYDLKTQQQYDIPGRVRRPRPEWDWELCPGYRVSLVSLKAADHRSTRAAGGITFDRYHFFWSPIRIALGMFIEKMDIVLKLLPEFARAADHSSLLDLLSRYTRAARADRRLLGPHIYRPPKHIKGGGSDCASDLEKQGNPQLPASQDIDDIWWGE